MNITIIILITALVLIGIQIFALVRMRQIIMNLRRLIRDIRHYRAEKSVKIKRDDDHSFIKKCQFCLYRQTFIKASINETSEDFYYRCKYHNRSVILSNSCEQFEFEIER